MSGHQAIDLELVASLADVEELARQKLESSVFDYCAGGAGDEQCLRENVAAFSRCRLVGSVNVPSDGVDTAVAVLGEEIAMPVMVAPVSLQRMVLDEGEVASAIAAERHGTVFCLSMNASCSPEEIAEAAPRARRWMQMYVLRNWAVTESVLSRAEDSGFSAVVVTVDVPTVGQRERDIRNRFDRLGTGRPHLLNDPAFIVAAKELGPKVTYDSIFPNPTASWADVERLKQLTDMPLVVKGILSPEDAERALAAGASAVIVSNHGGRQFDRSPATIEVLGPIAERVGEAIEVYLDSGVRRGSDVLAALSLGARAVLVGRPVLWGAAVAGGEGASHVLDTLKAELTKSMTLLGIRSATEVNLSTLL